MTHFVPFTPEDQQLTGWAPSAAPLNAGSLAPAVHIGYLNSPAERRYERANGRYHRWQNGVRHMDADTYPRLTAPVLPEQTPPRP